MKTAALLLVLLLALVGLSSVALAQDADNRGAKMAVNENFLVQVFETDQYLTANRLSSTELRACSVAYSDLPDYWIETVFSLSFGTNYYIATAKDDQGNMVIYTFNCAVATDPCSCVDTSNILSVYTRTGVPKFFAAAMHPRDDVIVLATESDVTILTANAGPDWTAVTTTTFTHLQVGISNATAPYYVYDAVFSGASASPFVALSGLYRWSSKQAGFTPVIFYCDVAMAGPTVTCGKHFNVSAVLPTSATNPTSSTSVTISPKAAGAYGSEYRIPLSVLPNGLLAVGFPYLGTVTVVDLQSSSTSILQRGVMAGGRSITSARGFGGSVNLARGYPQQGYGTVDLAVVYRTEKVGTGYMATYSLTQSSNYSTPTSIANYGWRVPNVKQPLLADFQVSQVMQQGNVTFIMTPYYEAFGAYIRTSGGTYWEFTWDMYLTIYSEETVGLSANLRQCGIGTYKPTASSSSSPSFTPCTLCASGTFTSSEGSTSCGACASGTICPLGASHATPQSDLGDGDNGYSFEVENMVDSFDSALMDSVFRISNECLVDSFLFWAIILAALAIGLMIFISLFLRHLRKKKAQQEVIEEQEFMEAAAVVPEKAPAIVIMTQEDASAGGNANREDDYCAPNSTASNATASTSNTAFHSPAVPVAGQDDTHSNSVGKEITLSGKMDEENAHEFQDAPGVAIGGMQMADGDDASDAPSDQSVYVWTSSRFVRLVIKLKRFLVYMDMITEGEGYVGGLLTWVFWYFLLAAFIFAGLFVNQYPKDSSDGVVFSCLRYKNSKLSSNLYTHAVPLSGPIEALYGELKGQSNTLTVTVRNVADECSDVQALVLKSPTLSEAISFTCTYQNASASMVLVVDNLTDLAQDFQFSLANVPYVGIVTVNAKATASGEVEGKDNGNEYKVQASAFEFSRTFYTTSERVLARQLMIAGQIMMVVRQTDPMEDGGVVDFKGVWIPSFEESREGQSLYISPTQFLTNTDRTSVITLSLSRSPLYLQNVESPASRPGTLVLSIILFTTSIYDIFGLFVLIVTLLWPHLGRAIRYRCGLRKDKMS